LLSTFLYPLLPVGVGRWECEGLVSYLCRLAYAHGVGVDDLVALALARVSTEDFSRWRSFPFWNRSNAVSLFAPKRTLALRDALLRATCVQNVGLLSFATLNGVIDLTGMSSPLKRHCPACYRERPFPEAFRPLLWDIAVVTACPVHKLTLVSSVCGRPHTCHLSRWSRRQTAGLCPTCGSIGLRCSNSAPSAATHDELWVSAQSGAMIAAVSSGERFSRSDVQNAVLQLATLIGDGYPYRAARVCGFSKARLYDWIEGKRRVKYPVLLALCSAARANVVDVLRGRVVSATGHGYIYSPRTLSRVKLPTPEIRRLIDEAITDERCPSVSSVARRAGVCRNTLKRRFPEEVRHLAIRWKEARAAEAQERRSAAAQRLVMLATELKADGVPWTVRNVWLRCGVLVTSGSRYHQPFMELQALESRTQDRSDSLDLEGR
jgi:hypothetical protein